MLGPWRSGFDCHYFLAALLFVYIFKEVSGSNIHNEPSKYSPTEHTSLHRALQIGDALIFKFKDKPLQKAFCCFSARVTWEYFSKFQGIIDSLNKVEYDIKQVFIYTPRCTRRLFSKLCMTAVYSMGKTRSLSSTVLQNCLHSTVRVSAGHVTSISAAHTCTNMTLSSTVTGLDNSHWTSRKLFFVPRKTACAHVLTQLWHTSAYRWRCARGSEPLTERLLTFRNLASYI